MVKLQQLELSIHPLVDILTGLVVAKRFAMKWIAATVALIAVGASFDAEADLLAVGMEASLGGASNNELTRPGLVAIPEVLFLARRGAFAGELSSSMVVGTGPGDPPTYVLGGLGLRYYQAIVEAHPNGIDFALSAYVRGGVARAWGIKPDSSSGHAYTYGTGLEVELSRPQHSLATVGLYLSLTGRYLRITEGRKHRQGSVYGAGLGYYLGTRF